MASPTGYFPALLMTVLAAAPALAAPAFAQTFEVAPAGAVDAATGFGDVQGAWVLNAVTGQLLFCKVRDAASAHSRADAIGCTQVSTGEFGRGDYKIVSTKHPRPTPRPSDKPAK